MRPLLLLTVLLYAAAQPACPPGCVTVSANCACGDTTAWSGGRATLYAGAVWDENATAIAIPALWPPPYIALPPMYLGAAPGFTLTAWIQLTAPGEIWALGVQGPPDQPDDWASASADFVRVEADDTTATIAWALDPREGGAGSFATTCARTAAATTNGWLFVGASFAPVVGGVRWTLAQGSQVCTGVTTKTLPARWWTVAALGGGTFAGWIAAATAYDDVAFNAVTLAALAGGDTTHCGSRPSPPPPWAAGVRPARVWASTLSSSECRDASTGAPTACTSASLSNAVPAAGGCGTNGVVTAGGEDAFPAITLDLGVSTHVNTLRLYDMIQARVTPYRET